MPPSSQSVITAVQRTFVGPYLDDFTLVTSQRFVVHDVVRLTLDPRRVGAFRSAGMRTPTTHCQVCESFSHKGPDTNCTLSLGAFTNRITAARTFCSLTLL